MTYVFNPPVPPALPVAGSLDLFPARRVLCVGRNYADHVMEMGGTPERNPPFFFAKPADALVTSGATVPYPPLTQKLHFEVELVVAVGTAATNVSEAIANDVIYGYAVGIDLTRRDLQQDAMKKGHPWEFGKAFDRSAPCGSIYPIVQTGIIEDARIWLEVNGVIKQDSNISKPIWSVPEVISILLRSVELQPGDLIYTGTPAGVGPLVPGDGLTGGIDGLGEITLSIGERN